jgi:hypothetical protein
VHVSRQAFAAHLYGGYAVEPEEGQVGQVFLAQGFRLEVGVDVPNSGEPPCRRPRTLPVGQQNLLRIPDDHLQDVAPSVDEDSCLPSDFPGDLREIACKFRGTYLGEGNPPPIDMLDSLVLIGL